MTLEIDGLTVEAMGTVLDAALSAGIDLPHLCKDDNLPSLGACRTCLVEADGRVVTACSLPAGTVRAVSTTGQRVRRLREGVLALTAAMQGGDTDGRAGPHGDEARASFEQAGIATGRFEPRTPTGVVDASNPFFSFHEDACILCGRCATACQDLQHIGAIGMAGRGAATRVTPGANDTFRESICTSCGSCVAACPTTALRPKGGERS